MFLANGNNRVVRLWLDSGGKNINVSINGKVSSSSAVEITKDVWRHVCLSYQSDFGAWALYVDSRLVSCQASQSVSKLWSITIATVASGCLSQHTYITKRSGIHTIWYMSEEFCM